MEEPNYEDMTQPTTVFEEHPLQQYANLDYNPLTYRNVVDARKNL
jgi:hypothetical protein